MSGFLDSKSVEAARSRFEKLFSGQFETGLQPDEWNWQAGKSAENMTRQICNGWKSDLSIARIVLSERVGHACAQLMNWPGTRINQDNVIWKPPGAKALGYHQDDSYQDWIEPSSMATCWIALDDTTKKGGTIEYARGSNHWPIENSKFDFHAPEDYHQGLKFAAEQLGVTQLNIDQLEVAAGDAVFHHGRTWHGSGENLSNHARRSVVAHCMSSESRFHPNIVGPIYGRYKQFNSTEMGESFFPIIYSDTGYCSDFLESYLAI